MGYKYKHAFQIRLHRNLHDNEVIDLVRMLFLVKKIYLYVGRRDVRIWKPDAKDQFSVKSFYNDLIGVDGRMVSWKKFWNSSIPPRVLVFLLGCEVA